MHVIELGVMAFLGLIVLFMVVRPLVKRAAVARIAGRDTPSPPARAGTRGSWPPTGTAVAVPGPAHRPT